MSTNYRTVYEYVTRRIESGFYGPGEKLPSIREFAELLGVGQSAVKVALMLLRDHGHVVGQQGKGTYVKGS